MSTAGRTQPTPPRSAPPPLVHGERLGCATFHERSEATPPGVQFELIGGMACMAGPVGHPRGKSAAFAVAWAANCSIRTPRMSVASDATVVLDDDAEPQPDLLMCIDPDRGGRTRHGGTYIAGAPELVVEISDSTPRVDLGPKPADYERAGVLEYVVVGFDPGEVDWHARRGDRLVRVDAGPHGLHRSGAIPGPWLDPAALLAGDGPILMAAFDRGLAAPEHRAFVERLARP